MKKLSNWRKGHVSILFVILGVSFESSGFFIYTRLPQSVIPHTANGTIDPYVTIYLACIEIAVGALLCLFVSVFRRVRTTTGVSGRLDWVLWEAILYFTSLIVGYVGSGVLRGVVSGVYGSS